MNIRPVKSAFATALVFATASALAAGLMVSATNGAAILAATDRHPANWGLSRIDSPHLPLSNQFRYAADGTGVNIYIIGTGVNGRHNDFKDGLGNSRVTYVGDFCTGALRRGTRDVDARDGYDGHETHVASYAAGRRAGVARNARIISLRTSWQGDDVNPTDGGGYCRSGQDANVAVAAAIDWIRGNGHTQFGAGPAVVNFSGGHGNSIVQQAILNATSAGYLFTLSGNTGGLVTDNWGACHADPTVPCVPRQALVVGGTRRDDTPLGSGYGPFLALYAPGEGLYGAGKSTNTALTIPELDGCTSKCRGGDSFAAPFVAGVAAAFLQRHPHATPSEVRAAILDRAATFMVDGASQRMLQRVRDR